MPWLKAFMVMYLCLNTHFTSTVVAHIVNNETPFDNRIFENIFNWLFIMPGVFLAPCKKDSDEFKYIFGTKWCGVGDKAENYDDLGIHQEEDRCCRTHDHCSDYIPSFHMKHGLLNTNILYSKLHCDCDLQFKKCLHMVNSLTSKLIGKIYFNILGTECYREDFPISYCQEYLTYPYAITNYFSEILIIFIVLFSNLSNV